MNITPVIPEKYNVIKCYGKNMFRINEDIHRGNIIVTSNQIFNWNIKDISDISTDSFSKLEKQDLEIIVIGTGTNFIFPIPKITEYFLQYNIAVDIMKTDSACGTYNFLLAEGRKVATALIAI